MRSMRRAWQQQYLNWNKGCDRQLYLLLDLGYIYNQRPKYERYVNMKLFMISNLEIIITLDTNNMHFVTKQYWEKLTPNPDTCTKLNE